MGFFYLRKDDPTSSTKVFDRQSIAARTRQASSQTHFPQFHKKRPDRRILPVIKLQTYEGIKCCAGNAPISDLMPLKPPAPQASGTVHTSLRICQFRKQKRHQGVLVQVRGMWWLQPSGGLPTDAGTFSLWNVSASSELKIETRSATGLWNAGLGWDVISRISRMFAPDGNSRFNISSRSCVPLQVQTGFVRYHFNRRQK